MTLTSACRHSSDAESGEDCSLTSFCKIAVSRGVQGGEFFAGVASFVSALSQDDRVQLLTDDKECARLVHMYGNALRLGAGALGPTLRSCRAYLSAVEACLASGPQQPDQRVPTALALLKSQALECFSRLIARDQAMVLIAEREEQQGTDAQLGQAHASASLPGLPSPSGRLCLYHSLDEAACLVGWIVQTMTQTNGKRSTYCTCALCSSRQAVPPPPPKQPLCLVAELWRALCDSQLLETMVRGLLHLDATMPEQGEQGDGYGDVEDEVATAVRVAYTDQLQLAEAARLAFGVRADRGTLASNLHWMPQGLPLPVERHAERKRAVGVVVRLGSQLMMSAGLVAAAGAAGGGTTYGLAPGPLVALAGDVLPLLWECGEGGEGAAGSSLQLLTAVDRRLEQWVSIIGREGFPKIPVRLGGIVDACRRYVSKLSAQALAVADQGQAAQRQRQQQQHNMLTVATGAAPNVGSRVQEAADGEAAAGEAAAESGAGAAAEGSGTGEATAGSGAGEAAAGSRVQEAAAGEAAAGEAAVESRAGVAAESGAGVAAAGCGAGTVAAGSGACEAAAGAEEALPEQAAPGSSSSSVSGTWLSSVPRHVAVLHAAHALKQLSTISQAYLGMKNGSNRETSYLAGYRPDWWWGQVMELLPLMATTGIAGEEGSGWKPILAPYRTLLYTIIDDQSTMLTGYYRDPSDDMENAFAADLLPALTRLVREGPAEVAARGEAARGAAESMLTKCIFDRSDWDQIMPYARPRELARLVAAAADVVRGRLALLESSGHLCWDVSFMEEVYASASLVRASAQEFLEVLKDESFMDGDRAHLTAFFKERGPWVGHCVEPHCARCHYKPTRRGGGRSDEGGAAGGSSSSKCPAERMSLNVSVAIQLLVPLLVRGVLWAEQQDPVDRSLAAWAVMGTVTLMCMRVLAESYPQQQQQQQQGKDAPSGAGNSTASSGQAGSGASTGGGVDVAAATATTASGPQGADHAPQDVHSWRELLLSVQPFTLLRLAMMRGAEGYMDPPVCALWALAVALPDEFAAALQSDPELTACIAKRAKGGEGSKADGSLVATLQQVLPGLPACKAVAVLEGRCGLPVVSRAKRQAARDRVVQLRPLWARARVLVDVEEVKGVLEWVREVRR